ncbi:MAG: single-stranded-DNA-specific exonuclease RecJ [Clostridia bacterium]|nr:single-stranded-DNA-specific exonuclease RecJ [Clostridia bacterium]
MIDKIWKFKNKKLREEDIKNISQEYHISPVIATVLLNRGIEKDDIPSYLKKSMSDVVNPKLMLDMDKAVERINKAIENKEKIAVYGDYDVDGITSTALLYEFLSSIGADVEYYIPDRKGEGYGINIMAVNKLFKQGIKLLITVDCGITAVGEVEFAKLQGMDVIITDHHTCKDRLPTAAAAILNPKRPDCTYPFDALAGVGVAFKLILALAMENGMSTKEVFAKYVDIATLGTIADVVPLLGENRIITDKGLKVLQNPRRIGLRALMEVAGVLGKPMNASTIAFAIAPRLNAAGRLGTATTAVELLLTKDENRAREIALNLDSENKERQLTERQIFDEALAMIASDPNFEKKKVIVLAQEDWHQGVIGIVASRLCDLYYKPCILISHSNGIGKGSGRSIAGLNLFDALNHCEKHLIDFGGHAVAAGLNINMSDLDNFIKEINKYADETLTEQDMIPSVNIDCPLSESAVTLDNAKILSSLEPFGMGNEKPVFAMADAQVVNIASVGADNKHLRLRIAKNNQLINCIGFGMGEYADMIEKGTILNLAFQMDINVYQGMENVQLILKDLKIKQ